MHQAQELCAPGNMLLINGQEPVFPGAETSYLRLRFPERVYAQFITQMKTAVFNGQFIFPNNN